MKKYFTKYLSEKLFLCSRDIQLGDKVYAYNGAPLKNYLMEEFIITEKPDKYEGEWIGTYINPDDEIQLTGREKLGWSSIYSPFKVIGQISDRALVFVKEADEFDETEILQSGSGVNISPRPKSIIFIKCPCCKIHI